MLIQIFILPLLLLYIFDELNNFNLTIKAIGHQWYWKYEYRDFWTIENFQGKFNLSTTINSKLEVDIFRLLDINNTGYLQLVEVPSKNSFLDKWSPICIINRSRGSGPISSTTSTTSSTTSSTASSIGSYTPAPCIPTAEALANAAVAWDRHPRDGLYGYGPYHGLWTLESYEADIKSSYLIYETLLKDRFRTVEEQIEVRSKLYDQLTGPRFHPDGTPGIERKCYIFIQRCKDADKYKVRETSHHPSFLHTFLDWAKTKK